MRLTWKEGMGESGYHKTVIEPSVTVTEIGKMGWDNDLNKKVC